MILIDLQMAFDTIDYEILPQKLKAIRFSETTIKCFKSYLFERIFLVSKQENKHSLTLERFFAGYHRGPH